MYALIEFAGKQFKIEEGIEVKVPYVGGKIGSKVVFDRILYLDDGKNKSVGNPNLKGVTIDSKIESHGRERKIVVFKFKRRKGYQKKNSHRQDFSILKVGKLSKISKTKSKSLDLTKTDKKLTSEKVTTKKPAARKKPAATKKPATTKKPVTAKKVATKKISKEDKE